MAKRKEVGWTELIKQRKWSALLIAFAISFFIRRFTPIGRVLTSKKVPGVVRTAANSFVVEGAIIATLYLLDKYKEIRSARK